ncbi:MAG: L,D-transpeptidase family protein [Candidatus Moranbacteria bacterium]|nr:L,D-transpeptidase family protein [Candidatus Moranbacteria bacterium]
MEQEKTKWGIFFSWTIYLIVCFLVAFGFFYFLKSNKIENLAPKVTLESSESLKPDQEIILAFNQPIESKTLQQTLKITPEIEGSILWNKDFTKMKFVPEHTMRPGQKYILAFEGKSRFLIPFKEKFEFFVQSAPKVISVAPFKEQGVGLQEDIFINFDKPTVDYDLEFRVGIAKKQQDSPGQKEEDQADQETSDNSSPKKDKEFKKLLSKAQPSLTLFEKDPQDPPTIMEEDLEFEVMFDKKKKNFVLKPEKNFQLNKKYTVEVFSRYTNEEKGVKPKKIKEFTFSTLEPLQLVKSNPEGGAKGVLTKQKFILNFDKPFEQESLRQSLEITPPTPFHVEFDPQKENIAVINPENFAQDTAYKIIIKAGLKAKDGSYLEQDKGIEFKTGNLGGYVNDGRVSTDNPKIKTEKFIDVNLSKQLLSIFYEGQPLGTYKISSGRKGMNTPTGDYKVMRKERNHWSVKYKLWMPYSMQFTGAGHFIHELPEWTNGYKEGANHLGIPVSHGCIRLGVGPAETVYNFSQVGTSIFIHY